MKKEITTLFTFLFVLNSCGTLPGDDGEWKKLANGIWRVSYGPQKDTVLYSDFVAHPPRFKTINQRSDPVIPDSVRKIQFGTTSDQKCYFSFEVAEDERVFGFGLQFDGINKSRRILNLKVDHFASGGGATHAPVPFFVSSHGYGVLVNTARFTKFYNMVGNRKDSLRNPPEVDRNPPPGIPQPGPWQALPSSSTLEAYLQGTGIELIVFCGDDLLDVVSRYNLFSGGGTLPPMWGLGFWHRVPAKFTAAEVEGEIEQFRKFQIPLDVIGLEPGWQSKSYPCTFEWQTKRFPNPKAFTNRLLDQGIRLNLWENPYVSKDAKIYPEMYPYSGSHLVWLGLVPDYMLPEARKILLQQHKDEHFDIGISGYKIDEVDGYDRWLWPDHATFPSGTSAEVMRQTYGLQMQQMLYRELYLKNNQRTFGLVRASNACASGYPFALYSDSYEHRQYIHGISSASLAGVLWCPEIRSANSSQEWINRIHTVCFSPLAMLNAWASGTKPWSYQEQTSAVRNAISLRMQLIPYLYTAYAKYAFEGVPPVRAMLLEDFEGDLIDDASIYMFGPDILVAPLVGNENQRKVKLPPTDWFDFYTGRFIGNGNEILVKNESRMPLFVRGGSLIPMIERQISNTREIHGSDIVLRQYGEPKGSACQLYEDDGESFDYLNGKFRFREFSVRLSEQGPELVESRKDDGKDIYPNVKLKIMNSKP